LKKGQHNFGPNEKGKVKCKGDMFKKKICQGSVFRIGGEEIQGGDPVYGKRTGGGVQRDKNGKRLERASPSWSPKVVSVRGRLWEKRGGRIWGSQTEKSTIGKKGQGKTYSNGNLSPKIEQQKKPCVEKIGRRKKASGEGAIKNLSFGKA